MFVHFILIEKNLKDKMIYHISIITGNLKFAGTDAKVYIQLKGSNGNSEIHRLHNSKSKNEFERGKMDHYHVFFLINCKFNLMGENKKDVILLFYKWIDFRCEYW